MGPAAGAGVQNRKIHFIGIAGAGMSATAKLLRDSGAIISGSDENVYPPVSDFLHAQGIPYRTPYAAENIPPDVDHFVIGKNAKLVPETNAEVAAAHASGLRIASFPELLSEFSHDKKNLVVAGSYGKSTSAALLAHCLETAAVHMGTHLDPSFFIGAVPLTPPVSARKGQGNLFVLEGDEYPSSNTDSRAKFLHYRPAHLLITPLAHDHLNVFPTPEDYLRPFQELMTLPPADAAIIVCDDRKKDSLSPAFLTGISRPVITYGLDEGDYHAADVRYDETTRFGLVHGNSLLARVEATQLGAHNVENIIGVAALLCSMKLLPPQRIADAVASFRGVRRRLDRKSDKTSIPIYEGFGSSYDKARSAIAAMRLHFPQRRLIVVFEPHTFSWRNRAGLHWYDDVFDGVAKTYIFEPATQGAATHDQASQAEIVDRVRSSGCDAEPISDPTVAVRSIGNFLSPNDAILLLSSGDLGGLIDLIPAMAEGAFPSSRDGVAAASAIR